MTESDEKMIDSKLDTLRNLLLKNIEFMSKYIENLEKRLSDMCIIVDALHEKRVDEIHFLDLVKELTYKINAYEKWKDYQKMPDIDRSFDSFPIYTPECQT